ncbi:MAG: hypothetical protein ABFR95_02785 [Actinomycetota bacterium]
MITKLATHSIERGPRRRHDARVARLSVNPELLERLDMVAVQDAEARRVIEHVCDTLGVEAPLLRFHARRSPYTGATEHPRWFLAAEYGEAAVRRTEDQRGKPIPQFGAIRLGRVATLMTVAHELGHHLVFAMEPRSTPAHGKVWIGRFDEAAKVIDSALRVSQSAPQQSVN